MIGRIYCVETRGECTNAHRCQQNCCRTHPVPQFQPDYGIEHTTAQPWYHRVPPLKYFICIGAIVGLVYGLVG